MARLRIKVGLTDVECDGTQAFLKALMPEILRIVAGAKLSVENLQARDEALTLVAGLKSDLEELDAHHQMLSDLNDKASLALKDFEYKVERFVQTTAFGAASPGALSGLGSSTGSMGGGLSTTAGTNKSDSSVAAAAGGTTLDELLASTKIMQETQMSFNLQYLQLQSQMQHESRAFTAVSNIMKTKHETVKNSISNIR